MYGTLLVSLLAINSDPSKVFQVPVGGTAYPPAMKVAVHTQAAEFFLRVESAIPRNLHGEVWFYDTQGKWTFKRFRSSVDLRTANRPGALKVRFKNGIRPSMLRLRVGGKHLPQRVVKKPLPQKQRPFVIPAQPKQAQKAPPKARAATRDLSQALLAVKPREIPPIQRPKPTGLVAKLKVAGMSYYGYTFYLSVNQELYDRNTKKLLRWTKTGKLPSGIIWEEAIPVGASRTFTIRAVEEYEGLSVFNYPASLKELGAVQITITNNNGRLEARWRPSGGAKQIPLFSGPNRPRTRLPAALRETARIRMANGGSHYEALFQVLGNPRPAPIGQPGRTGKIDPNSPFGKRLRKWIEKNKDKLDQRRKRVEEWKRRRGQ